MQTIKVTTTPTTYGIAFGIQDGNSIAAVAKDTHNPGKWAGGNAQIGACNNRTFVDAVEFISDAIANHFAAFGINVEFINA